MNLRSFDMAEKKENGDGDGDGDGEAERNPNSIAEKSEDTERERERPEMEIIVKEEERGMGEWKEELNSCNATFSFHSIPTKSHPWHSCTLAWELFLSFFREGYESL